MMTVCVQWRWVEVAAEVEPTGHHEASRCDQEWRREGARQKLATGDGFQED